MLEAAVVANLEFPSESAAFRNSSTPKALGPASDRGTTCFASNDRGVKAGNACELPG